VTSLTSLASLAFGSSCCIKVGAFTIVENKRYNVSNITKFTCSKDPFENIHEKGSKYKHEFINEFT
jgi:hypothetical protein